MIRWDGHHPIIFLPCAPGRSPVVLTERTDHLEQLAERLFLVVPHLVVRCGGMGRKPRKKALDRLAAIPENEERFLRAPSGYLGHFFLTPRLDTLFLALPVFRLGTITQYAARPRCRCRSSRKGSGTLSPASSA